MLPHHALRKLAASSDLIRPAKLPPHFSSCRLLLSLALLATFCTTARADEVRLYRIVGSELELYRRIDSAVDVKPADMELDFEATATLREEGLFDIRPEDMEDDAKRPNSRGDGFLWDASRQRWIGLTGPATLSVLEQRDGNNELRELHRFEVDGVAAYSRLWPTDDPDVYFASLFNYEPEHEALTIVRIEIGEDDQLDVRYWPLGSRLQGNPVIGIWPPNIAPDGRILIADDQLEIWEFSAEEPVMSLTIPDRTTIAMMVSASPNGQMLAAVDWNEGGYIDLWRDSEQTPFLTLPTHDYSGTATGLASFTPDGEYLWVSSVFHNSCRVWRCSDWVETDEYVLDASRFYGSSTLGSSEWIIVGRDTPLDPEPTEWIQRGLHQADQSHPTASQPGGFDLDICGGSSAAAMLLVAAMAQRLVTRSRMRRQIAELERTHEEHR